VILVDSSVWIDYFRGIATPQAEKLDGLLGSEPLAVFLYAEVFLTRGGARNAGSGCGRCVPQGPARCWCRAHGHRGRATVLDRPQFWMGAM